MWILMMSWIFFTIMLNFLSKVDLFFWVLLLTKVLSFSIHSVRSRESRSTISVICCRTTIIDHRWKTWWYLYLFNFKTTFFFFSYLLSSFFFGCFWHLFEHYIDPKMFRQFFLNNYYKWVTCFLLRQYVEMKLWNWQWFSIFYHRKQSWLYYFKLSRVSFFDYVERKDLITTCLEGSLEVSGNGCKIFYTNYITLTRPNQIQIKTKRYIWRSTQTTSPFVSRTWLFD